METQKGVILRIMTSRGFGFIRQEDGTDIYFHAVGCVSPSFEELREGMPVEYIATAEKNGKTRAIGVVSA